MKIIPFLLILFTSWCLPAPAFAEALLLDDEEEIDDPDILEGFRVGAGALLALDQQISSFVDLLDGIDREEPDLGGWFDGDKDVFRLQFSRLYGRQE